MGFGQFKNKGLFFIPILLGFVALIYYLGKHYNKEVLDERIKGSEVSDTPIDLTKVEPNDVSTLVSDTKRVSEKHLLSETLMDGYKPDKDQLLSSVALITRAFNQRDPFSKSIAAVNELGDKLSDQDILALLNFLNDPSVYPGEKPINVNALKNNVLGALILQDVPSDLVGWGMSIMATNSLLDTVLRDYVIQYFPLYFSTHFKNGKEVLDEELHTEMLKTWWTSAQDGSSSIAGTAISGLARYAIKDPLIKPDAISETAYELASDPHANTLTRITAIQVATELKNPNILVVARQILKQEKIPSLNRSAIAALGKLGDRRDFEYLSNKLDEPELDESLVPAINNALSLLQE